MCAVTEDELGAAVDDVAAADVDEPHAGRRQRAQRRVHVADAVHAHAPALALLQHTHIQCHHLIWRMQRAATIYAK